MERVKTLEFRIVAKNAEQRRVFGWFSVTKDREGRQIVDLQKDVIFDDDLEEAAYDFVKQFRAGGEMHEGRAPNELIASLVFTDEIKKALEIPPGTMPNGWFGGFEVPAPTFQKVKEGNRLMFSIEGEADREEVEVEVA